MTTKVAARPVAAHVSPLVYGPFRLLWIAATASFVGSFVQEIGERWLILDLTQSPLSSAMLATAFVTASLVMTLPAGVLSDRVDRRRLVILSQLTQASVALTLGILSLLHVATPKVLVIGAACAGVGMALGGPAWAALISDIVRREQVADAVTLNAVAFNIARAVGPAIGGVILGAFGAPVTFLANACSFLGVVLAVASSRPAERQVSPPSRPSLVRAFAEPFVHAARDAGIRSVSIAMVLFSLGASFVYVLAPAFAKLTLEAGPRAYGLVLGAMGIGGVLGAFTLRRLRAQMKPPRLLAGLMLTYGISAIGLSRVHDVPVAIAVCIPAGVGWLGTFTSLSALIQIWAPAPLRGRSLALYTVIHLATWALGASLSGALAETSGVRTSMLVGGAICVVAAFATSRMPLPPAFARPVEADGEARPAG
jgi:MFS family permease